MLLAQVAMISTLNPEELSVNTDAGTQEEVKLLLGPETIPTGPWAFHS